MALFALILVHSAELYLNLLTYHDNNNISISTIHSDFGEIDKQFQQPLGPIVLSSIILFQAIFHTYV